MAGLRARLLDGIEKGASGPNRLRPRGVADLLERLTVRERTLLIVTGAVALLAVFLLGVIEPLTAARRAAAERMVLERELLIWMEARAAEVRAALAADQGSPADGPVVVTLSEVEKSLRRSALHGALAGLAPTEDGGLEADFTAVSYTGLIAWLEQLDERLGYRVEEARIDTAEDLDHVRAKIRARPKRRS